MNKDWGVAILGIAVFTLTVAAVCQELEKPPEERKWRGKVLGFIPYDFRPPTLRKVEETFWNPSESRVLTPTLFGIGWAINFYALLENLELIEEDVSERSFLMPGEHMKAVLEQALEAK